MRYPFGDATTFSVIENREGFAVILTEGKHIVCQFGSMSEGLAYQTAEVLNAAIEDYLPTT